MARDAAPSYKRKHRDLWYFAKLEWREVQLLTLKQQYQAYCAAVLAAVRKVATTKGMPKGFSPRAFESDLASALARGKASHFTRAAHASAV